MNTMGATRWNLADLVTDSAAFDEETARVTSELIALAAAAKTLTPTMEAQDFAGIVTRVEELETRYAKLSGYAELSVATNQQDEAARLLQTKIRDLSVVHAELLRPLWRWCKGLSVDGVPTLDAVNAKRLFAAVPKVTYILTRMRELARYTLSEAEERIVTAKDMIAISALTDLRTAIETEQTYTVRPKGKRARTYTTQSELTRLTQGSDPAARRAAYDALFGVYKKNLTKYTLIYQAVVKDWDTEAKRRGYATPISMMNMYNDLSDKSIQALLAVVQRERGVFQEFFRLKAKILGVSHLSRYDLYAPVGTGDGHETYPQALSTVFSTFAEFSPRFAAYAKRLVDDHHVDSHPRVGKQSGAFCMPTPPGSTPYVLLNYMGGSRDTLVVAHEFAHGVHDMYAEGQSILGHSAPLPLAETASTFGELLVFETLYRETKSAAIKKSLLVNRLSETYATVLRQAYFTLFEERAHEAIGSGATGEQLADLWYQTLEEQFDGAVTIPKDFRYEWAYIPHMVNTPFYCYAYSFGGLLTMSLYERYREDQAFVKASAGKGESFVPKIEAILAAGGAVNPRELLLSVGMDIESEAFWEGGFTLVKRWVRELSQLV